MERDKEVINREAIQRQTEEFLAKGGQIERAPIKRVSPKGMKWISRRGRDFTGWKKL